MPGPSGLTVEVNAVAATYSDDKRSRRILAYTVVFSPCQDEDAITANAKASQGALALLTDISVDWHEVLT
jgi:hypothetical protein